MHKFTSFADIERELARRASPNKRFSHMLDHMFELLELVGNPHKRLKVIHIAGTSGKTSTAYYAAALLKEAGLKVGLTVSPHVDAINERVQIGLVPLPEADFCKRFGEFYEIVQQSRVVPNYFETLVAFAFWEFAARQVDYAVVEVGIGGLLDSTNVFDDRDKICIITDIGLDHTNILGSTLPDVTAQKAGIIQLHNAVFCNRQAPEVMEVIRQHAERKQADLHTLTSPELDRDFDFLPLFQQRNFGLALRAVDFLLEREGLSKPDKAARLRAAGVKVPARMEIIEYRGKTLVLDGAHNFQKITALAESLRAKYGGRPVATLVGMVEGRDYRVDEAARAMAGLGGRMLVTEFDLDDGWHEGSVSGQLLAQALRRHGVESVQVFRDPRTAFDAFLHQPEEVLVITGSFYLLNHIRPLIGRQS